MKFDVIEYNSISFEYDTGNNIKVPVYYYMANDKFPVPVWFKKRENGDVRSARDVLESRNQHIIPDPNKPKNTATYLNYVAAEKEYLKDDTENHFRIKNVLKSYNPTKEDIEFIANCLYGLMPETPFLITDRRAWIDRVKIHPLLNALFLEQRLDGEWKTEYDAKRGILFFDLYCPELGLRFEFDGSQHKTSIEQKMVDEISEWYLGEKYGIITKRYISFIKPLDNEKYREWNMKKMLQDIDRMVIDLYERYKSLSPDFLQGGIFGENKLSVKHDILDTLAVIKLSSSNGHIYSDNGARGLEIHNGRWYAGKEKIKFLKQFNRCLHKEQAAFLKDKMIPVLDRYYGIRITDFTEEKVDNIEFTRVKFLICEEDW